MTRLELNPCRWFRIERHGNRGNYRYYAIYYGEVKIESKDLDRLRLYINDLSFDRAENIVNGTSVVYVD